MKVRLVGAPNYFIYILFLISANVFAQVDSKKQNMKVICDSVKCTGSCEELSDSFCDFLWNDENLGNLVLSENQQLLVGNSTADLVSHSELLDFEALIASKCSLPAELMKLLKINCSGNSELDQTDWLNKLKLHLDSRDGEWVHDHIARERWKWRYNDIKTYIKRSISLSANRRTITKYPYLKTKIWEELDDLEKSFYMDDLHQIKSEIVIAKYENHPNFLRVKRIFDEVKQDIKFIISSLKFSVENKESMLNKIDTVRLVLPIEDPRVAGVSEECSTTLKNAYYYSSKNIFVICSGYFNAFQVDGHLYRVIAHEISHSIDPQQLAMDEYKTTKMANLLGLVYSTNGQIDCQEWKTRAESIFISPESFYQLPNQVKQINKCLVDNKDLNELTMQALDTPTSLYTSKKMDSYAGAKYFTKLSQATIYKKGKLVPNQYYLNPQLLEAKRNNYIKEDYFSKGYFHLGAVFVQNMNCELFLYDEKQSAENIRPLNFIPTEVFQKAIVKTEDMFKVYRKTLFSFVGRHDRYLQHHNLAQPADEFWADWMASHAMKLKIKRITDELDKRIFVLSTQAKFCRKDGLERLSGNYMEIEKIFSKEVHPLYRNRRLSYFLPEFADAFKCKAGNEIQKLVNSCHVAEQPKDFFSSLNENAAKIEKE